MERVKTLPSKGVPDLSLTIQVLEALSASTQEQRHRLIAELPVLIERSPAVADDKGVWHALTTVLVKGRVKFRLLNVVDVAGKIDGKVQDATSESNDTMLFGPYSAEGVAEPSRARSILSTPRTCPEIEDDCEATQEDRDDALAVVASLESEQEGFDESLTADESECWYDAICYTEEAERGAANFGSMGALDDAAVGSTHQLFSEANTHLATCVSGTTVTNCADKYLAAFGAGALFVAAGVATATAATSPDPITKGFLKPLVTATIGSFSLFVGLYYEAYNCHQSQK